MTHDWRKLEAEIVDYLRREGYGSAAMPNTIYTDPIPYQLNEAENKDIYFSGGFCVSALAQALAQAGFLKPTVVSQKVEP